jgi:hypothetical protein
MCWSFVSAIGVTSVTIERTTAQEHFAKLVIDSFLGKGNRQICPSCVVLKIREQYPSVTGVYMGYRDH